MDAELINNRVEKLRQLMALNRVAAAILSRPQHIYYFTGIQPVAAPVLLVLTTERKFAVAPANWGEIDTFLYRDYDIQNGWSIVNGVSNALEMLLLAGGLHGAIVGVEEDHLSAAWVEMTNRYASRIYPINHLLWQVRKVKDHFEIATIEQNIHGNDRVFERLAGELRAGMSELDVWSLVQAQMCQNAGGPVILEGDLGVGVKSANPDAKPGAEKIQKGESLFVDIYSATNLYYADTTRVFSIGAPDARQLEIFSILQDAISAGEMALAAGVPANHIDSIVRRVIEQAGFGGNFPHHSGHAYGLFQQEKPYFIPAETMLLEPGMVVTLEPGIYLPGWGGMRLESNYLVGKYNAKKLDQFPRELTICGG